MEITSLNINKSEIARELNVDRRTVSKYIEEFQKSKTRERENALTDFCKIIKELLDPENTQIFYFKKKNPSNVNRTTIRYETPAGKQAQVDRKESMDFLLNSGEIITINIFVYILSYSRFRVYYLSLTKTQDILFNFLDSAFETVGGVPDELLTDNMKTVMDDARTQYSKGKVNARFAQFAKDYGFKIRPCLACRPQTKATVSNVFKTRDIGK
jgi:transposase